MKEQKYIIIKNRDQYDDYCRDLERLVFLDKRTQIEEDTIELLTVLIELYDQQQNYFEEKDPVSIIKFLLDEHKLKPINLAKILGVSKGLISDVLNYKKGISKKVIRGLAQYFKVDQELFNRPYELKTDKRNPRLAKLMNVEKDLEPAL